MQVVQVLHMNKGDGETSYARNSTVQRKLISISKPIIEKAVLELVGSNIMGIESMGIADLGCSSGPNTLLLISHIIDVIHAKPSKVTELRVSLNDLFSNDFNSMFTSLPSFYNKLKQKYDNGRALNQHVINQKYHNGRAPNQHVINPYISAVPGSFYGQLFPRKSMHFVHSSFTLHWLSQVPDDLNNKGKIFISNSSPKCVLSAYSMQFQKDFTVFLRSRAQEMVDGGRMVLSIEGRPSFDLTEHDGTFNLFELLAQALMTMVSKGLIEEEKVDSFNLPYYTPYAEELNLVLEKEGSFIKDCIETFEVEWHSSGVDIDRNMGTIDNNQTITSSGQRVVANTARSVTESLLGFHFGKEIMDVLFQIYEELISKYLSNCTTIPKYTVYAISLIKKN